MHKISRVRFVRVGHPQAWFNNVTIGATDLETGEPCDTILFGANGDGKSTLIALLFSVFEPRASRFLKHLSKASQEFHEYFGPDVGFVLVEWERQDAVPGSSPRHLVTGQAVAFRADKPAKNERLFFAFNTSDATNLDSEPFEELRTFETLRRWVHQMDERHRNDLHFYSTTVQDDWRERLRQPIMGVDPVLLAQQVGFSISEGGMDDAFLSFKSEDEFIGKFFDLTINRQHADTVRDELVAYAQKHSDRPDKDRRLKALTAFRPIMAEFSGTAAVLAGRQAARTAQEGRSAALGLALRAQAQVLDAKAEEARTLGEKLSTRKNNAMAAAALCDADAESFGEEILCRQSVRAQRSRKEADRRLETARALKNSLAVAQLDVRLTGLEAEIVELDGAIAAASKELEPERAKVRQRAGQFRFALDQAIDAAENEKGRHQADAEAADRRVRNASTWTSRAASRAKSATLAKGRSEAFFESYRRRHDDLIARDVLGPDESASTAQQRWDAHRAHWDEQAGLAADRIEEIDDQLDGLGSSERQLGEGIATQTALIGEAKRFLTEAGSAQKLLAANRALQRLLETEAVDPDDDQLPVTIGDRVEGLERQERDILRRRELLEDARQTIQDTDLAFRDEDVNVVVDQLSHLGIGSAKPYAHWVADAVRDTSRARSLVLSDPARFLGVHVQTAGDLERVRERLDSLGDLPLRRPVVVSVPHDVPSPHSGDRLVLGPRDDSAYNKDAALAVLERVEHNIGEEIRDLQRVAEELAELRAARFDLDVYLRMHGPYPRAGRQADLDYASSEKTRLAGELEVVRGRITGLKQTKAEQERAKTEAERERDRARANVEACRSFIVEYDSRQADQETALRKAEHEEAAAERWRQAWEAWGGRQAERRAQSRQAVRDVEQQAKSLVAERAVLGEVNAIDDGTAEPLDVVRGRYKTARDALIQLEAKKVEVLVVQRKEKVTAVDRLRDDRSRAERPWDETQVAALVRFNLEELVRRLDLARSEFSEADAAARRTLTLESTLQGELGQYAKARKFPSHRAVGIDDIPEDRLDAEVRDARTRADGQRNEAKRLDGEIVAAQAKARDAGTSAEFARDKAEEIARAVSVDAVPGTEFPDLPAERPAIGRLVDQALRQVKDAMAAEREAEAIAQTSWEEVRKSLDELKELTKERRLAEFVSASPFTVALIEAPSYIIQIDERIGVIAADLEQFAESTRIIVQSLVNLLAAAVRILNRAAQAKIPAGVPKFSGLAVLKTSFRASDLPVETAREKSVENFIYDIIAKSLIPATGPDLAARLLRHVAGGESHRFNIKILKPKEGQTDFYMPIDRVTTSGGEGLTTAILLYCVLAQLRAEEADNRKGASGGVLILDNPFAKANKTVFIQAQRQMAAAMGLQLIYATGLKDYNALGQFQRFWRLRPARRGKASGRIQVEIEPADLQIEEQPDGPDRATA